MNKVNLCWVISDGRKGHEIQSTTLAQALASTTNLYSCTLRQPWESFAPRIIPAFHAGISWSDQQPDYNHSPDIIITTGRKAAAVGKYINQTLKDQSQAAKHLQILNPKDKTINYDLMLLPRHDRKTGENIIQFTGSIHPFSPSWYQQVNEPGVNMRHVVAIFMGNPPRQYFKNSLRSDIAQVKKAYPHNQLFICGSPRLTAAKIAAIKTNLSADDICWFNNSDGPNPYQSLLRQAKHLFVTADSINMMNECASSHQAVTLLAQQHINSPKHQHFIKSLVNRWQGFECQASKVINTIPYAVDELIKDYRLQKLLNSPVSSKGG